METPLETTPLGIPLGIQWILELEECVSESLQYVPEVACALQKSAEVSQAGIVTSKFHQFEPSGVSGVVVLSQSHITVHTWPEHKYAAVDMFFCGEVNVEAAIKSLERDFRPQSIQRHRLGRDTRFRVAESFVDGL